MRMIDQRNAVNRVSLAAAALMMVLAMPSSTFAQSLCNGGTQIVTTRIDVTESCTITGSLRIHGGMVKVDFTAAPGAVLSVQGDVAVIGAGVLWIEGGTFEIQQNYNRHRQLLTTDDATVILKGTKVIVNQDEGLKYLVHYARDRSKMYVVNSVLDPTRNWVISDCRGSSTLIVVGSQHIPTEISVKDHSTINIGEPSSQTGIWLDLENGAVGSIDLPVQSDAAGQRRPFSWRVGRGTRGLAGVGWQVVISNAWVGLGLESHSGSQITVNGKAGPSSGEIKVAYHASGGVQTLSGLGVGLQNRTLGANQLTLRNVELGPIAWQVYAHENEMLTISSSVLNEVGVSNGGHITLRDSIVQFGGVTSLGNLGASIAVHNSQIHGQIIEAMLDGTVDIHDSAIFGAAVVSHAPTSTVNFHRGAFQRNSSSECPLVLAEMVNSDGLPRCNPFLPPGAAVTRTGEGTVTCDGTYNCSW